VLLPWRGIAFYNNMGAQLWQVRAEDGKGNLTSFSFNGMPYSDIELVFPAPWLMPLGDDDAMRKEAQTLTLDMIREISKKLSTLNETYRR